MPPSKSDDKSGWRIPSIHAFVGGYGPFKPPREGRPLEGATVLLVSTLPGDAGGGGDEGGEDVSAPDRYPMLRYAARAQELLLRPKPDGANGSPRGALVVVDVADMITACVENRDDADEIDPRSSAEILADFFGEEAARPDLVKGFGKTLLRTLQRLELSGATVAAEGPMCPVLLKVLAAYGPALATDVCLLRPEMPDGFVEAHLLGGGAAMGGAGRKENGGGKGKGKRKDKLKGKGGKVKGGKGIAKEDLAGVSVPKFTSHLHVIFATKESRERCLGGLVAAFTKVSARVSSDGDLLSLVQAAAGQKVNDPAARAQDRPPAYDPERCNEIGESIFLSLVSLEMNPLSKQYEMKPEEVTSDLLRVFHDPNAGDVALADMDWSNCERQVGALVLRGHKCLLVRSLYGEWDGMRLPSLMDVGGDMGATAVKAVAELAEVDDSEVAPVEHIAPLNVYAPGDEPALMKLVVLYATGPPPAGSENVPDEEDQDDPYDWYTFPTAMKRLDERSAAALRSAVWVLAEAAAVGVLPRKWGGIFGQEVTDSVARQNEW